MRTNRGHDLISPAFQADPFPTFDRMRAEAPLVRARLPVIGETWLAVTHEACATLLKDQQGFVRDARNAGRKSQIGLFPWLPRPVRVLADNMLGHDDPRHRHLRGLVDQAFQRRGIEVLRPMIAGIADRLIDGFADRRAVDLMQVFCRDLPLSVICAMLGLPARDHARFKRWMGGLGDLGNVWAVLRAMPGVFRLVGHLQGLISSAELDPDGLVAALRDAEIDGARLSEDELVSMVFLLFGAGQETTTHLIAGGLQALLAHPDQMARLRAEPALMATCVEECLRHVSPVQMSKPRFACRDTEFAGRSLARGDLVVAMVAAANCDPAKFDDPHRFEIGRHPNPHLSFGTGVHFCLGFQLARAEAAIALARLIERFPDLRFADAPAFPRWSRRFGIRSLSTLPVRLVA